MPQQVLLPEDTYYFYIVAFYWHFAYFICILFIYYFCGTVAATCELVR